MKKISYPFSYNLQLFAKEGSGGEKTEDATAKKLGDARDEGKVAKSNDLVMAASLIGLFLILKAFVSTIGEGFLESFQEIYSLMAESAMDIFTINTASVLLQICLKFILIIAVPIFVIAVLVGFIANVIQVKLKIAKKALKPKLSKFNPINGFKNLFSKDKLVELLKAVFKIGVICYVVYTALQDKWALVMTLYSMPLNQAVALIGDIVIDLGLKISLFFLVIACADFYYQKRKFKEDMKMTKQEVKDEFKQSEGDPQVKGKIRQKMREVSRKRMMQDLPKADVVITNPTHLAIAIQYDKEVKDAPMVIAKGADYLANKIKEAAKEHNIEIVENKPLARMLYYNVDLGDEIPPELYQMVAEVLAYVYGLKGKL